jgi:hypothetical protein
MSVNINDIKLGTLLKYNSGAMNEVWLGVVYKFDEVAIYIKWWKLGQAKLVDSNYMIEDLPFTSYEKIDG